MTWLQSLMFSYIGPETALPAASALVAITGALLICWRFLARIIMKVVRFIIRKRTTSTDETGLDADQV